VLSSTVNGQLQSQHEHKNSNMTAQNKTNKKQQKKQKLMSVGF
jgi:hypothetical protein